MTYRQVVKFIFHPIATLDDFWEERSPKRRVDRIPSNICLLIGLMLPTASIILRGPLPTSAVANMSETLQVSMCGCIFAGCAIKLHGACLGAKWYPFRCKHVQNAYRWGCAGAPAAVAGLGVYTYYLFLATNGNVWSAISACLTPALGLGIGLNAIMYWFESRRIERVENQLITRKVAEINDERNFGS